MDMRGLPGLFTAAEVGEALGMTPERVAELAARREIAHRPIGEGDDGVKFTPADVQEYLDTIRVEVRWRTWGPDVDLDSGMILGLWDVYHDLQVGPCTAEMVETEDDGSGPIHPISCTGRDDFDCTYAEWAEHLRAETYEFIAGGGPMPAAEYRVPTKRDLDRETLTVLARGTLVLKGGRRIEKWGERWAYVSGDCDYLAGVDEPSHEHLARGADPSLTFGSPLEAYRAWARSEAVGEATSERRAEAGKRLGRDLNEPPFPEPEAPSAAPERARLRGPWKER